MTDQFDEAAPASTAAQRRLAFVFPGQGSQYVGMGAELVASSPAAAAVSRARRRGARASRSRASSWTGPAEELDQTVNAQPAILATIGRLPRGDARARPPRTASSSIPLAVAGHSAGQYAAAVAADAIDFETAINLVRERGRIMQERGIEGGMGAVIGLTDEQVHEVVDAAREHGEIGVANANAPGQIVLSGVIPALAFALEMSKTVGARKAVRLTVSVASHSPLMRRARDEFSQILAKVPFREPRVPMLGNVHATVIRTADGPAQRALRAPRARRAVDRDGAAHGRRRGHRLRRDRPGPRPQRPHRADQPRRRHARRSTRPATARSGCPAVRGGRA